MNKSVSILIAAVTAIPVVYMVYFLVFMMSSFDDPGNFQEREAQFNTIFKLHFANMLLMLALIVGYIVYLFRTNHVPQDKKALWAVVIFMGNIFAMPVFWYFYMWKPAASGDAHETAA